MKRVWHRSAVIIYLLMLCICDISAMQSFGCQCGMAKVGEADPFRKKRQSVDRVFDTFRMKRNTRHHKNNGSTNKKKNTEKQEGLSDKHSRIVNGYEPQRRPWMILITIKRHIH